MLVLGGLITGGWHEWIMEMEINMMDHEDGDQHDGQHNGDGDLPVIMGHTVSLLCECRPITFCFYLHATNDVILACDDKSRTIPQ